MGTKTINARIDETTKKDAEAVLKSLGLNMSQAINLFFKQVVYTRGIPFELRLPNKTTVETFRKTDAGEDLHTVENVEKLAEELKS